MDNKIIDNNKIKQNLISIIDLIGDTKKEIADNIYENVLKGNVTVGEDIQLVITTTTEAENLIKGLLEKNTEFPSLSEVESSHSYNDIDNNIMSIEDDDKKLDISYNQEEIDNDKSNNKEIIKDKNIIDNNITNNMQDNFDLLEEKIIGKNTEKVKVDEVSDNSNNKEVNINENKAEVIGEIQNIKDEKVINYNERRKAANDLIYNKYDIMANHYGYSSSVNIKLYVAPLETEENNPNVPIIVHAYSAGKYVTASSLDTKEEGHSIVTIVIEDFNILIRGSFVNGVFKSYVLTTGISANQGDKLNVISKEVGYEGNNPKGCGHIKFKENDDIYEIFPLSKTEDEYMCVHISKEFLDYYVVAKYGIPKIRIINNGIKQEIVAGWTGGFFEADII
jgi:hypothetical protein